MNVIIFGCSHHNTLGVIRSLGEKGIPTILILVEDKGYSFVGKSKYLKEVLFVHDENEGIRIIQNWCITGFYGMVISTSDGVSAKLDEYYDSIISNFSIFNIAQVQGRINNFMNKQEQSCYAITHSLNVPNSVILKYDTILSCQLNYPVITKPIKSILGKKTDILICYNKKQLEKVLSIHPLEEFQVQEFIEKDFEYQLIGCSFDAGNEIVIPCVSKIIRCPQNTNIGYLKIIPICEFSIDMNTVRYFIRDLGYSGLFSLEFIRDKSGKDYFMELNMRNDGNAYAVTGAGVNLPYLWYLYHTNRELFKIENKIVKKSVTAMPELSDFKFVLKRKVSLFSWIKDYNGAKVLLLYNTNDKTPFYYYFIYRFISLLRRK